MDGNGRWAEARGLPRVAGHREGSLAVRAATREARRIGLEALTLYAFSAQNWARPPDEVAALMQFLAEFLDSERAEIMENAIRLDAIGDLDRLPDFVRDRLERLRRDSASNGGMMLTLALSYDGSSCPPWRTTTSRLKPTSASRSRSTCSSTRSRASHRRVRRCTSKVREAPRDRVLVRTPASSSRPQLGASDVHPPKALLRTRSLRRLA